MSLNVCTKYSLVHQFAKCFFLNQHKRCKHRVNIRVQEMKWWCFSKLKIVVLIFSPCFFAYLLKLLFCYSCSLLWEETLLDALLNFSATPKGLFLLHSTGAMNDCVNFIFSSLSKKLQVIITESVCTIFLSFNDYNKIKKEENSTKKIISRSHFITFFYFFLPENEFKCSSSLIFVLH